MNAQFEQEDQMDKVQDSEVLADHVEAVLVGDTNSLRPS
jgi:hypothetical protein